MFAMPENYLHRRLLLALTVAVVLGYAWVGSRALEPRIELPQSIVASATLLKGGANRELSEAYSVEPYLVTHITGELSSLNSLIGVIGGLSRPVALVIDADRPEQYRIEAGRLELGSRVVRSEGQLTKAVLKAWLLQRGGDSVTTSLARLETASDLLLFLLKGKLELESVGARRKLKVERAVNWLAVAHSVQGACSSVWRSLELRDLCVGLGKELTWSRELTPMSLRAVVTTAAVRVLSSLTLGERIEFLQRWIGIITVDSALSMPAPPAGDALLDEWREWIGHEVTALLALRDMPAKLKLSERVPRVLGEMGLMGAAPLTVQAFFIAPASGETALSLFSSLLEAGNKGAWSRSAVGAVETADGVFLVPGMIKIGVADVARLSTRWMIWESCKAPSVTALLAHPLRAGRVLFVQECEKPLASTYTPLFHEGVEGFALANSDRSFVQLKTSALDLAVRKGLIADDEFIGDLLVGTLPKSTKARGQHVAAEELGLLDAKLKRPYNAYRVLGAIEAIEWYR